MKSLSFCDFDFGRCCCGDGCDSCDIRSLTEPDLTKVIGLLLPDLEVADSSLSSLSTLSLELLLEPLNWDNLSCKEPTFTVISENKQ